VGSSLSVAALAVAPGVWSYGALRFLQVLFIAPVFPIVVARIAQTAGGEAIGVINAARIGASFIGPVMATSASPACPCRGCGPTSRRPGDEPPARRHPSGGAEYAGWQAARTRQHLGP